MTPKPDDRPSLVDSRVADAWRDSSSEVPSPSVDAAILAAARREVSARPETVTAWEARAARASRRRWWPLAAAATVAAIAVGVLQLTPTDKVVSPATDTATVSDVPAPAAKPDAGAAPPPATSVPVTPEAASPPPTMDAAPRTPSQPNEQKAARNDAPRSKVEAQRNEPKQQAAPVPSPDPFPARKAAADSGAATGLVAAPPPPPPASSPPASPPPALPSAQAPPSISAPLRSDTAASAPMPAPAPPVAKMAAPASDGAAAETRAKERRALPIADWVALIRRLRAEGKTDEAIKELAAFRAAHPDHEKLLPQDLRDWRPTEK